ncbi:MAG: GntR family transcriptional regulator [Chloroflexi bacterium]|nr:GntR family transcriptional regulator [Chloroflexota bacterium]
MNHSINPDTSTPYYEQIRVYLLSKIESGDFKPHSQIPSERTLSEQFGVSRMTVKHAIKELVSNGRLYTRVGKGTFVNDTPITQQLETLTGFSEDMEKLGKSTNSRVLQAESFPASTKLAKELQIVPGSTVVFLQRLRIADQQPVALESSYLNAAYCQGILDHHDFSMESLYSVLRNNYYVTFGYAEQKIQARSASASEAELLEIDRGFPLLHITRVTFTKNARPIEYVESAYRGDRYIFRARLINV